MRNQKLLVTLAGLTLFILFIPLALAQAPIEGWDKAKFGMSPEQVKETYREEIEELKKNSPELIFEGYREEQAYYELSFIDRALKGSYGVAFFYFIDNELFEISTFFCRWEQGGKREERRFWLTSLEVESFLRRKYGAPVEEERIGEGKILEWRDVKGNGLSLMVNFEGFMFEVAYFHKELAERWEAEFAGKNSAKEMEIESF